MRTLSLLHHCTDAVDDETITHMAGGQGGGGNGRLLTVLKVSQSSADTGNFLLVVPYHFEY